MRVVIFGATGMVGLGVVRECLLDPDVTEVLAVARSEAALADVRALRGVPSFAKLTPLVAEDVRAVEVKDADACFFCLGVSSAGMKQADYERITYGLALAAAEALSLMQPRMRFVYVSGAGTDSTEKGRAMWARVKGRTENALLRLPLEAYMFRPGLIQPLDGIQSRTASYRMIYLLGKPLLSLLRWMLPNQVITTRELGQAMLGVARHGYPSRILEVHGERMIERTFDPGFRIRLHRKDLSIAVSTARDLDLALPNTAATEQMMNAAISSGDGDKDHSALILTLERLSGLT